MQVATAESLTGGDVGGAICTVPGASAYYRGGVISYAYEVKARVLGVDAQLLATEGAVNPEVAAQMAAGAARVCGADYAVSTTGVAGPDPADGQPGSRPGSCGGERGCDCAAGPRGAGERLRLFEGEPLGPSPAARPGGT